MINGIGFSGYNPTAWSGFGSGSSAAGSFGSPAVNPQSGITAPGAANGTKGADNHRSGGASRPGQVEGSGECQTCKNRKYQDGSNENVSFKSATHISPQAAAGAVWAHEGEHVANAYTQAAQKDGKVVRAAVSIHTSVCPECGRTYVSGGVTNTSIKYGDETNPYVKNLKAQQEDALKGQFVDYAA